MELPHPARRRPSSYAGTPQRAEVRLMPAEPGPWTAIRSVGGLCWVAGSVDGHWVDMHDTLDAWASPSAEWDFWTTSLRFFLPPYVLGLCAIALVLVARRHHREAVRAAELASAYAAARMAMLSAQLQPHFLFNSLHAISVLIDDSPRQAATMLARLGDFLRHALESSH